MRKRLAARLAALLAALAALFASGLVVTHNYACGCAPAKPEAKAWPVVTGTPAIGQTLSTSNGTWVTSGNHAAHPNTGYTYGWQQCDATGELCTPIGGAATNTYLIAAGDAGSTLRAVVTAANAGGSTSQASAPTPVVAGTGGGGTLAVGINGQPATACTGSTLNNPSSAAVNTALDSATAGSTVCINGAVSGTLALATVSPSSNVTLASTACSGAGCSTGAGASIPNMTLSSITNLTVQGFTFTSKRLCTTGTASPFYCTVESGDAVSNVTFQYNTIENQTLDYAFQFESTSGAQTNISILYNQMDHVGSCLRGDQNTSALNHFTFANNVCGPYIGYGLTNANLNPSDGPPSPQHYIQFNLANDLTIDHNAFEGPYDPTALAITGSGGYTGGVHNNVFHAFNGATNLTFSNNILWHTESRGNTILLEGGSGHAVYTGIHLTNNLGIEDPSVCPPGPSDCPSNNQIDGPQSSTFVHNTFLNFWYGLMLGCNDTTNPVGGYTCDVSPSNAGMTTQGNISAPTTSGVGNLNWYHYHCDSGCVTDHNVSGDSSAPAGTGATTGWTSSFANTSWTPANGSPYAAPPTNYYAANGGSVTQAGGYGYQGDGGPVLAGGPAAPSAAFTFSPASPTTGQQVTFDSAGSTCPATPCTYAWTDAVDNSSLGSGTTLNFTFSGAGTKQIVLTVTDAQSRTATVEHDVIVAGGGGGGGTGSVGTWGAPTGSTGCDSTVTPANIISGLSAAAAGSTVCVSNGSVSEVDIGSSISKASMVTVRALNADGVTITGGGAGAIYQTGSVTNVTWEGFQIDSTVNLRGNNTNVIFQNNNSQNWSASDGDLSPVFYLGSGTTQTNVQFLYNQMDHTPDCLSAVADTTTAITFAHNVCGPGGLNSSPSTGHYIQAQCESNMTIDHNLFVGPANAATVANAGSHLNTYHACGANLTFTNNIVWHEQSKSQGILIGDLSTASNVAINNNLFVTDPTSCGANDCATKQEIQNTTGATSNNNTLVNNSGASSGGLEYRSSANAARNISVNSSGGAGDISIPGGSLSQNASQDGSGSSGYTWTPCWQSTTWTWVTSGATPPYTAPDFNTYYKPLTSGGCANNGNITSSLGYQGTIGP